MSPRARSTTRAAVPGPLPSDEEGSSGRPRSNDLGLELYRQQTLLAIMTARMRETAGALEHRTAFDLARLRRALEVHRRYLLEVHLADEERLARTIARTKVEAANPLLKVLRAAHPKAVEFEQEAEALLERGLAPGSETVHRLARLFTEEADRIDQHQAWETENLHGHIDAWLPKPVQSRLLAQIRRFNAARVDAEIALISWASQLHPSAD